MAPRFSKTGKRLGRPPKNPQADTTGTVFSIDSPAVAAEKAAPEPLPIPIVVDHTTMIECEFMPIPKYEITNYQAGEKKLGIYSTSMYKIDEFKNDRWVIISYLKADFEKHRLLGLTNPQILQNCLNYLNAVEPKKKFAKKEATPKYGRLKLFREEAKFINKFDHEVAIFLFTTDDRKCEYFWGEGEKYY
jgi:hypothetical protein